ncbi:MAG: AAA family ATPase [Planctomycetota bacterium]
MSFEHILGQENAVAEIEKAVTANRLAHAYLFEGPPGIGKYTTAIELAHHLLCGDKTPHATCRVRKTIENGANISVAVIRLNPESRTIKIDNIRDILIPTLWRKSGAGNYKIVIVDEADSLGIEAQNALLKTLEEPPDGSLIILICASKDSLIPTVVSRCQLIRFKPLKPETAEKIKPETEEDEILKKEYEILLGVVDSALNRQADPIECARKLADAIKSKVGIVQQRNRNELSSVFDLLLSNLGKMAIRQSIHSNETTEKEMFPEGLPEQICRTVLDTKYYISRNVNILLALENFFIKLGELRKRNKNV